ncbi:Putative adenylate kinase/UMP-CMP kinase, adenylate kinase, active site lid [Septoria linicola]|uniref:GTP:AMP phosphotransferase, mitochondrial n=1 Tax=Septoria linicola TaxID=215465 RepID=A0A9Q9AX11_9PEZI|nr:Putative adenylate kinase/UMP-CMP kinase, adenylate kinase, active site lid [Septoria linicola]
MPTSRLRRAARVILIGAPGVGKGTQTERLMKRFPQLSAISSGDLLRENVRNKTPLGIQAESLMNRGALVPDGMILRLIRNALTTRGWLIPADGMQPYTLNYSSAGADLQPGGESSSDALAGSWATIPTEMETDFRYSDHPDASFVLDGFPRNAAQAEQLEKMVPVNMAIQLHTPTEIILDRICNRWVHPPSGRVYNTTFNAPKVQGKDDITGEKLIQRDDDKPEVWLNRLKTFDESSRGLVEHFRKQGVLWRVEGNSSDEITPKLFAEFEQRFGEH